MKKFGKKVWLVVPVIVIILAVLGFVLKGKGGAGGGMGGPGGPGGMPGLDMAEKQDMVRAETPERGDIRITTDLTGTLESSEEVYVYAKASGDVTAVAVKAGDTVTAGQVLFEIDTEQVETAKNTMDSMEVSMSEAKSNLNRMQLLYDNGDLSDREYEQYVNQAKTAELQYQSAKLAYEKQVEYSTVTAPINGRVESCSADVYDRVSPNQQLCVITGEGNKKISFYATQRMLEQVNVGDEMTVMKNGKEYAAEITEINSMVDAQTGLFEVEAQMENTEEVAVGSTVKLSLTTRKTENALLIPIDAVYYSGGEAFVYLYEDGIVRTADIEVGLEDSEYAEVLSGLTGEEMVITTWTSNLYEGAKVQLMETPEQEG